MSYKIYGLVEPGKNNHSDIVYIGVTAKSLKKRLSGHSGIQPPAMHLPLKKWVMELRGQGLRPGIILLYETDRKDFANFLEAFFYYRLRGQGNNLFNSRGRNIWGFIKKGGARSMAQKLSGERQLEERHFKMLREYYFRNLGTVTQRENYEDYL